MIKVVNLKKIYQDNGVPVKALDNINLDFEKREFTVIAGPSGSGKTTLLNLIGALDLPTEGKVFFEGEDLSLKSKSELAELRLYKLGFVFQAFNLIPVLTALENVEFTMILMGVPEEERHERAYAILEELKIAELANKRPNEMSGGQQQRVAVARAIVTNPSVVLADEPTANLDSDTGTQLMNLMEKLNRDKNITFIFSSHDPVVIERGRRHIILRDGKVVSDTSK
ncbi:MAG: Cell division transporter, ATP-binding protein FtsE [Ignavibacteriae bacterium]|nr:MAG: Cell division transporter, ATP-binding protein FtsE [Ignavibacteriota bacterium]